MQYHFFADSAGQNKYIWVKNVMDYKNIRIRQEHEVDISNLKLLNHKNNQLCWLVIGKINN